MWVDILLYNRPALDEALASVGDTVAELRRILASGEAEGLRTYLESARTFRQGIER
jgi:prephenate dehydrogenase